MLLRKKKMKDVMGGGGETIKDENDVKTSFKYELYWLIIQENKNSH